MEWNWIAPALGSPLVFSLVTIGDKFILSRVQLRLTSFYLFVGASQLLIAAAILAINAPASLPWRETGAAFGGGFLWGIGLLMMFWVLRREEASRVTPVWQSSPIFVAILAVLFLGESLAWYHWIAIFMVVGGATAVSLRRGELGNGFALRPTFFVLLAGALLIGIAQLLLKIAAGELSVWHSMAFRGMGLFSAMVPPFLTLTNLRSLGGFMRRPDLAPVLVLTETVGPFIGNVLLLTAIANGPVSLVSALLGTRPLFVFAGALVMGLVARHVLAESMTGRDLAMKASSAALVVGGVFLIAL
ncbi:MAG: DMT family transporter [Chloroflexi bacterium]|nr:DMT family transporter [Chloroflexota bacterium]